jgi:hypothetical protein
LTGTIFFAQIDFVVESLTVEGRLKMAHLMTLLRGRAAFDRQDKI